MKVYRIAVFLSGTGTNFEALWEATQRGDVPGRIVVVMSNNPEAGGVARARSKGIPTEILRREDFEEGSLFAQAMLRTLRKYQVEVICLAGYMKKVPSAVVRAYPNRILNLHPALLPKYGGKGMYGLFVHQAVLAAGEEVTGATIHLVDQQYDHGPILGQEEVPVLPGDTPEVLQERVHQVEHRLYPRVLKEYLINLQEGRVLDMIGQRSLGWPDRVKVRYALLSVYRKEFAHILGKKLMEFGVQIWASSGTAQALTEVGIPALSLDSYTGFQSLLKGRIKTLHPFIFAPLLARSEEEWRGEVAERHLESAAFPPLFDLVAVDLYPFEKALKEGDHLGSLVDLIDIGGVSLIRAGAKNFQRVAVLHRGEQFEEFATRLMEQDGETTLTQRRRLAQEAFWWTSRYDSVIAYALNDVGDDSHLSHHWTIPLDLKGDLRYGENPHQAGFLYTSPVEPAMGVGAIEQWGGKPLSYNNYLDIDIALRLPYEFDRPAVAILKHTTPCGVGMGETLLEAFYNARSTDPVSAFGGIVGFNREVDGEVARALREGFIEVVCATHFTADAVEELKKSKNLRIIKHTGTLLSSRWEVKSVWGGLLVQTPDWGFPEWEEARVVTRREPTSLEWEALKLAWICCRYVKSNAIVITDHQKTLGIGAGQMSRVDAAHIAVWKAKQAGHTLEGAVAASDAFFPFPDGVEVLAKAGVKAIVQPGGSVRDREVIETADQLGLAMVLTGRRHFRH